jgi:hypothetical protein
MIRPLRITLRILGFTVLGAAMLWGAWLGAYLAVELRHGPERVAAGGGPTVAMGHGPAIVVRGTDLPYFSTSGTVPNTWGNDVGNTELSCLTVNNIVRCGLPLPTESGAIAPTVLPLTAPKESTPPRTGYTEGCHPTLSPDQTILALDGHCDAETVARMMAPAFVRRAEFDKLRGDVEVLQRARRP